MTPDVVVVGGGIVGACSALELARAGADVEVLERGGGWGEGCSWGNAGLLVPSHARPIAAPEALRSGLKWMVRPDSPFGFKPKPSLAPWLARYVRASTARRAHDGEALQRELSRESLYAFRALAADGIDGGFEETGCLTVHASEEHAHAEAVTETGRALGARLLTGDEARELEPALTARVRAAVLFPAEARCDPVKLAAAVGAAAEGRGVRLRTGVEAYGLGSGGVETTHGPVRAGRVVVAAGAWSGRLARTTGVRLPLQGGKGYAAEWAPAEAPVRMPLYLHDHRVVANPMGGERTRMTGGLLLDGLDESFDGRRVRAIAAAAEQMLGVTAPPRLTWRGLRPCTPDGLPVIGAHHRAPDTIFATGHGMLGVTLAPLTGRLVASIAGGSPAHPALERLSPERF